ncbi:MAG TPA: hypothetical protein VK541_10530 [Pedobacter sp.]|uniref:hypothetical protein n=1 Tax=Pedobacter sp. TaxID=1411316 RepID=UPI002BEEBE43|nr:hypothetical protein [Pedobacter sp.]HMI02909.1 hypothetical protein [Pedobacter sp.]
MKRILLSLLAVLAMNTAYGQVKATSAELNAGTDDAKFATPLALQGSKYLDQSGAKLYAATAAGANTYTAAISPAIVAYSTGQVFYIKITTANTGASTLNLNGLGAKALVKDINTALVSDDLLANKIYAVYYDGTNFLVMNVATVGLLPTSGGKLTVSVLDANTVFQTNITYGNSASTNLPTVIGSGGVLYTASLNSPDNTFQMYGHNGMEDSFWFRRRLSNAWGSWFQAESRTHVSATYLPLTGGTLTGGLTGTSIALSGKLRIGPTSSSVINLYNNLNITGGTTAYGNYTNSTIMSDVTTTAFGFRTSLGTEATSFALTDLQHYAANQNVLGAGSSVTNQYGFVAAATLTGATNNYGFYSSIPQATGRYNFYANGSAYNYFAGQTGFGTLPAAGTAIFVQPQQDNFKAITARAFSPTQSANIQEWQNSAGTVVSNVSPAGNFSAAGLTLTAAPVTSAGGYSILTRNDTNGNVEKIASSSFNQTLSLGATPGNIVLSGGNNISLASLSKGASNAFLDANAIGDAGLFPNVHTTGSTNYPSEIGGGIRFIRANGTALGYFEFDKAGTSTDALQYRVGTGASTFSTWQTVASREWATDQFQPLTPLGSGLRLTSAGTLYSGYETGTNGSDLKILKISNPPGGQFKGAPTTIGVIKIKLPSNVSVMYAIKGTLFQYDATNTNNRSTEFLITCYGSNMGNGYSATFTGNNAPSYPVRWYTDGTTPAIYIGDLTSTWRYVAVSIDEVQASFRAATVGVASTGWSVSLDTAFTGTLSATQLNTLPFSNLNQPLAGFAAGADNALSPSDTQIAAFGKLQGQLNAIKELTTTAAGANLVYAGPATGTAAPTLRRLQRSDLTNAFGTGATTGVLDWSDITNTQPGSGPTLLRGNAANGFGSSTYYHPFTFEYSSKTGIGNITQLAYPYSPDATDGIQYRTRHSGTYSAWRKVWDSSNLTNLNQITMRNFSDLQGRPTTLTGYGITDGATAASVTAVQGSVTTLDGNAVHKTGIETIMGTKFFNGGVGIGLLAATVPSAYKLAVGGGIIAESVKVKPQTEWPDYVFEKGYPMLSLRELEAFIVKNKHLPEVPAAAEVKKEGLDLGEMDSKLLKKIEELTLYLIDLKKENETLKERLDKLEKK